VGKGHLARLKVLVKEYNVDITVREAKEGYSPLAIAAWRGHLAIVKYLYEEITWWLLQYICIPNVQVDSVLF